MAIYHCSAQVIGRSNGRSATGAAAYRGGVEITDARTGLVHDYTRKQGVDYRAIVAPDHAPAWVYDRTQLWNHVEQAEKRKDAQLCREVEVALPRELTLAQMQALVTDFARSQFISQGMVADIAIHHAHCDNPHTHILLTTRDLTAQGFGPKNRDWNRKERLQEWRQAWAHHANRALELAGQEPRLDHRTLAAQGLERVPQIHHGPKVMALEQQGIRTDRGDQSRAIEHHNAQLIDLQAQRRDLESQLNAGEARDQFRTLWEQHQAEQARQQPIHDLAERAAAEFRRQLDTQREAERARERQRAHRPKPERDRERELKRELEHELKREREHELKREREHERERSGPELDF